MPEDECSRSLTRMPERLDRVTIALDARNITISWEARQALQKRLYYKDVKAGMMTRGESTDGILRAFEAVGATRPVELTKGQRMLLLNVLRIWPHDEKWAIEPEGDMPAELSVLRDALAATCTTPSRESAIPRFEVFVTARVLSEADRREHSRVHGFKSTVEVILASLEYLGGVRQAIEADARVSDPETNRGPEGTILANFVLSAATVDEAEAVGRDVFRAALLEAGERREWTIFVGAKLPMTEAELARCRIIVTLRPDLHVGFMWPIRQALIRRLEYVHGTGREAAGASPPTVPVREMFEAVPTSLEFPAKVSLTPAQETALLLVLEDWSRDPDADEAMPQGLIELRDALNNHLHDAEQRSQ